MWGILAGRGNKKEREKIEKEKKRFSFFLKYFGCHFFNYRFGIEILNCG